MKAYTRSILGATAAGLMVLSFQNCSDFALQEQVLIESGLYGSANAIDAKNIPRLISSDKIVRWSKPGQPSYIDKTSLFFADAMSVVVAFPRNISGVIVSVPSGTSGEGGLILVYAGRIYAWHVTSDGNYTQMDADFPSIDGDVVVAASFGIGVKDMTLLVNGVVQTSTVRTLGVPADFEFLKRTVSVHPSVKEHVVYGFRSDEDSVLTGSELNSMSRYVASNNMIANVIFDPSAIGTGGSSEADIDPRFVAVKSIVESKCTSCHNGSSGVSNYKNLTPGKAVSLGIVKAGKPLESQLYYRLQGSMGGGTKDMPRSGSISPTEVQAVYEWISAL